MSTEVPLALAKMFLLYAVPLYVGYLEGRYAKHKWWRTTAQVTVYIIAVVYVIESGS